MIIEFSPPRGIEGAARVIAGYHLLVSNITSTCFDGWSGLGASAVLKSIAQHPPPSLVERFSKIIHIDCSKWKSRRALQRAIAEHLDIAQWVNDALDRQDMEDDFSGEDENSRAEIKEVGGVILRSLMQYKCLVIFHNGSDDVVDLVDFGIPPQVVGTTVLWTYRGRLRHVSPRLSEKVATSNSHYFLRCLSDGTSPWKVFLAEEASEIALYTHRLGVTPEVAKVCCMYLLSLNHQGGNIIDYNWVTHASNYWVCDGIVAGAHDNQAWDIARALQREIRLEDYSSNTIPDFGDKLDALPNRWIFANPSNMEEKAHPGTTSLFLASQNVFEWPLAQLLFHKLDQLHVLKMCRCSFSFQSPPFHCCPNLRFLGLESCMDQQQSREDKDSKAVKVFRRLWVLDICCTDWELSFAHEPEGETSTEIREVHIKKGKIWHNNLAWRKLRNLSKLCIGDPTCSWETGDKDEFKDMVNLELLELSGNSSIQVLPSMSSAISLKTLILDGCVLLEHVGPEGLPPSLESFRFDAGTDPTRISKISLAGCVHLKSFLLRGAFPVLEELDLSGTSVRKVDLSSRVVQVIGLNIVILMGCKELRALLWSRQLKVIRIDTHGRNEQTKQPYYSESPLSGQHKNYGGSVVLASDARIIESLLHGLSPSDLITNSLYLHLHNATPSTRRSKRQSSRSDKDIIHKPCCYNIDASLVGIASNDGDFPWPPPSDRHVEVSEGISLDVEGKNGITAIHNMMWEQVDSLHVHDNSCMLAVNPKPFRGPDIVHGSGFSTLRWCRVERCPKLQAVFMSYSPLVYMFPYLEAIWASHIPMATCIWSKGLLLDASYALTTLRSIHIYNCPRLKFVLPLSTMVHLHSLETLHITQCGDLRQVVLWEPRTREHITQAAGAAVKDFPKLKHIHLHDLPSLQEICEGGRMSAPVLESVELRGCWALRRIPAIGRRSSSNKGPAVVVRVERDCWEKLQWDGPDAGHHPSLYEPHFSSRYYRKQRLLRGTVLR